MLSLRPGKQCNSVAEQTGPRGRQKEKQKSVQFALLLETRSCITELYKWNWKRLGNIWELFETIILDDFFFGSHGKGRTTATFHFTNRLRYPTGDKQGSASVCAETVLAMATMRQQATASCAAHSLPKGP